MLFRILPLHSCCHPRHTLKKKNKRIGKVRIHPTIPIQKKSTTTTAANSSQQNQYQDNCPEGWGTPHLPSSKRFFTPRHYYYYCRHCHRRNKNNKKKNNNHIVVVKYDNECRIFCSTLLHHTMVGTHILHGLIVTTILL